MKRSHCLVLTLEEAHAISAQLYQLASLYSIQTANLDSDKSLIKPLAKIYESLNKKIATARKTIRSEQCGGIKIYNKKVNDKARIYIETTVTILELTPEQAKDIARQLLLRSGYRFAIYDFPRMEP